MSEERHPSSPEPDRDLLTRLLSLIEETAPLRINIEDYLGIFHDIPGLDLPVRFYTHDCAFCRFSKSTRQGYDDCVANKRAINRLLQIGKKSFHGLCHLGVTDLVRPVVVEGICVAGVFYGSVVVRGTEAEARRRIRAYCRRRGFAPDPHLRRWRHLPRIEPREVHVYADRLRVVTDLLVRLIDHSGVPLGRYHQEKDAESARLRADLPGVLQAAVRHIGRCYPQQLSRSSVARHIRCNPNYLSSLFSKHLGLSFPDYLNSLRIERAKILLRDSNRTIGDAAFAVGFENQSHFNACFKSATGLTPGQWRSGSAVASIGSPRCEPHLSTARPHGTTPIPSVGPSKSGRNDIGIRKYHSVYSDGGHDPIRDSDFDLEKDQPQASVSGEA